MVLLIRVSLLVSQILKCLYPVSIYGSGHLEEVQVPVSVEQVAAAVDVHVDAVEIVLNPLFFPYINILVLWSESVNSQ